MAHVSTQVIIFANPTAGRGKARQVAAEIAERLTRVGLEPDVRFERPTLWQPPKQCPRAAVSIGGDGTLRGVVARLVEHYNAPPPVAVVPMGTANLMGRHLDNPWDAKDLPSQIAAAIATPTAVRWNDAATANGALFLLMAGVGFDAAVVHELDRLRHGPIRLASYVIPTALAISRYRFPPLSVTVDDKCVFDGRPAVAFVANVPEYGTGFSMVPQALADDGLVDVCVLPVQSIPQLLGLAARAALGTHLKSAGAVYARGTRVRITSPETVPVQLDGDAGGHTPVLIESRPRAVPLFVRHTPGA